MLKEELIESKTGKNWQANEPSAVVPGSNALLSSPLWKPENTFGILFSRFANAIRKMAPIDNFLHIILEHLAKLHFQLV